MKNWCIFLKNWCIFLWQSLKKWWCTPSLAKELRLLERKAGITQYLQDLTKVKIAREKGQIHGVVLHFKNYDARSKLTLPLTEQLSALFSYDITVALHIGDDKSAVYLNEEILLGLVKLKDINEQGDNPEKGPSYQLDAIRILFERFNYEKYGIEDELQRAKRKAIPLRQYNIYHEDRDRIRARNRFIARDTAARYARSKTLIQSLANNNLTTWLKKGAAKAPPTVEIIKKDTMSAAYDIAHEYGVIPTVLNFANADTIGGGFAEGAQTQEEDLCRGTSLGYEFYQGMHQFYLRYDYSKRYTRPVYSQEDSAAINCQDDKQPPLTENNIALKRRIPGTKGNFAHLEPKEVFPFNELRAAAQCFHDDKGHQFTQAEEEIALHKICAILDKCIAEKKFHVVLGAFGCGAFNNPTNKVAELFKKALDETVDGQPRAARFKVIKFALIGNKHMTDFKNAGLKETRIGYYEQTPGAVMPAAAAGSSYSAATPNGSPETTDASQRTPKAASASPQ